MKVNITAFAIVTLLNSDVYILAECYDEMINGLLENFDQTANLKQFLPLNNKPLSYRLLCHRYKSTQDIQKKTKIKEKIQQIIEGTCMLHRGMYTDGSSVNLSW